MKVLDIDVGNTFLKWRVSGARPQRGQMTVSDLTQGDWPSGVGRVRVASVAGAPVNNALQAFTLQRWGVCVEFARTAVCQAGVTNSYVDPSRMGVDRWLAMLSAYQRAGRSCWVVDCGSAITVEQLTDDGRHVGGYIIPGLRLMSKNLLANTAEIIVDHSVDHFSYAPGVNTSQAVQHGVNLMFTALAAQVQRMAQEQPVYVTGGDGQLFCAQQERFIWSPDLVFDGLELALG